MHRIFCFLLLTPLSPAAVRSLEVTSRTPIVAGYERIAGSVHFGLNPHLPANQIVRDLEFAALNSAGEAECAADFEILQPVDASKGNGTILFEVSNRGGKGMLSRFDLAGGGNEFGDQWVLQQGYTLVWLGWEWDIPASNRNALHFAAPHFRPDALPAAGLVRSEFTPSTSATVMTLGDRTQEPIPVSKPLALYVRQGTDAAPKQLPAASWTVGADGRSVEMHGGFEAGMLYEFVYQGKDPVIAGTGLAAMRDFISFLKFGGTGLGQVDGQFDKRIGREGSLKRAIGFGISQSGRLLREFLYDGFNADESGRRVFDGVWADVAGAGRGSFNFRYAQPSRDGWPYMNAFYPTDLFPFTDTDETDPVTHLTGSLLARARAANVAPKIFFTNDSSEYWGRAASLIHIAADGRRDASISADTRIYFNAGVQHMPRSLPLVKQGTQYLMNPVDHRPIQRALLADLQAWIKDGMAPPPSVYPKLSENQLTPLAGLKFPALAGVATPEHPRSARRLDFGPEFETRGIILIEPPKVTGAFPVLVPQTDADGIDLGGIRLPEAAVPLATLTGWNLRSPEHGASTELAEFYGSIFPFAKTKEARSAAHDSRLSIAERYANREEYLNRVNAAAATLIERRLVLPQDHDFVVDRAMRLWDALLAR
jgi:hypothetical protein